MKTLVFQMRMNPVIRAQLEYLARYYELSSLTQTVNLLIVNEVNRIRCSSEDTLADKIIFPS